MGNRANDARYRILQAFRGISKDLPAATTVDLDNIVAAAAEKLVTLFAITRTAFTPVDSSGASLAIVNNGSYVHRQGNLVSATFDLTFPATADGSDALVSAVALPTCAGPRRSWGAFITFSDYGDVVHIAMVENQKYFVLYSKAGVRLTNANLSGKTLKGVLHYETSDA